MGKITDYTKKPTNIGTALLFLGIIFIAVVGVYFLTASSDGKLQDNDTKQQNSIIRDSTKLADQDELLKKQGDMVLKHDTAINDLNNYVVEVDPRVSDLETKVISLTGKNKHQQSLIYELQNDVSGLLAKQNTKKVDTNVNKTNTPVVTSDNGEEDDEEVEEEVEEDPEEE